MAGLKTCLFLAISTCHLGQMVNSKKSSNFFKPNDFEASNYADDVENVLKNFQNNKLTLYKDDVAAHKAEIEKYLYKKLEDKQLFKLLKSYVYAIINRYENDGKFNSYSDDNGNVDMNQKDQGQDYSILEVLKNRARNEGNEILMRKFENEIDDRGYVKDDENEKIKKGSRYGFSEDDNWEEQEDTVDKVIEGEDQEFGIMDYLVDSNWANEEQGKEEGLKEMKQDKYVDPDYIPDDYFDNSEYEA